MSVVFISHNGLKTALLYQPSIFLKGASVLIILMLGLLIFFLIPWLGIKWHQYRRQRGN